MSALISSSVGPGVRRGLVTQGAKEELVTQGAKEALVTQGVLVIQEALVTQGASMQGKAQEEDTSEAQGEHLHLSIYIDLADALNVYQLNHGKKQRRTFFFALHIALLWI
eukprot:1153154-Pelagomonas_calceolata.AAC.7